MGERINVYPHALCGLHMALFERRGRWRVREREGGREREREDLLTIKN
jgi:hypothetical protein